MLDELDVFEARVRERAFRLWQEAGCPENSAEAFWHHAREIEMKELNLSPEQLEQVEKHGSPIAGAADFA